MDTNRKIAIIVGVLFITGTVAGILSLLVSQPILGGPDYLSQVSAHANQLILGAFLILIMGFALALVPIVLFPVLRKQNETLAVGYVVFRGAIETVVYIASAVSWLVLIPLSRNYVNVGAGDATILQALGDMSMMTQDTLSQMLTIVFSLGAVMLYVLLYQSKLIPRWLSIWGLIAILLHFATAFILVFGFLDPQSPLLFLINFPIFLQEMVMAVWLIVKGFSPSALAEESA
jgi:hypothetical protein